MQTRYMETALSRFSSTTKMAGIQILCYVTRHPKTYRKTYFIVYTQFFGQLSFPNMYSIQ